MENIEKEELVQLLNFYKQRCSDIELQLLQLQIKFNKINQQPVEPVPATKTSVDKNNK